MFFNDVLCCRWFKSAVSADFCDFCHCEEAEMGVKRPAAPLLQREFLRLFQGAKVPTSVSDHP